MAQQEKLGMPRDEVGRFVAAILGNTGFGGGDVRH